LEGGTVSIRNQIFKLTICELAHNFHDALQFLSVPDLVAEVRTGSQLKESWHYADHSEQGEHWEVQSPRPFSSLLPQTCGLAQ
jgi:hypothetical protein